MKEILPIVIAAAALVCVLVLALVICRIISRINKLISFTTSIAHNHNTATYNFARFIVANLHDTAMHRDLTNDEKEFFHQARNMINYYEELNKAGHA